MTDDGGFDVPLGRRSVLTGLGVAGLAGLGTFSADRDGSVRASSFTNYPVGSLPGLTYSTSMVVDNRESVDIDEVRRESYEVDVVHAVQQTNATIITEEDASNPTCNEDAFESVEYRFTASTFVQARYRPDLDSDDASAEPFDGSGVTDEPLFEPFDGVLSVSLDDQQCGSASLQPHYTEAIDLLDTDEFDLSVDGLPRNEEDFESHYRNEVGGSDSQLDAYLGAVVSGTRLGFSARGLSGDLNALIGDNTPSIPNSDIDVALDTIGSAYGIIGSAYGLFTHSSDRRVIGQEYGLGDVTVDGDGQSGVQAVVDFSVRVPSDGDAVTVTTGYEQRTNQETNFGEYYNDQLLRNILDEVTFEITIPGNDNPDKLGELAYPEIELGSVASEPSADVAEEWPVRPETLAPAVGESTTFEASDLYRLNTWDETGRQWYVNGNPRTDAETLETEFGDHGYHTVQLARIANAEAGSEGESEVEATVTHDISFQVGDDPHLQPTAEFRVAPYDVSEGEEVELDASPSFAPDDDITYDWTVESFPVNQGYRVEPTEESVEPSADAEEVTFIAADRTRTYRVELRVEHGPSGYTDVASRMVSPSTGANAEISDLPSVVPAGEELELTGTDSEPAIDHDIDRYEWKVQSVPANQRYRAEPEDVLSEDGPDEDSITFTPSADRIYSVVLTVESGSFSDFTNATIHPVSKIDAAFSGVSASVEGGTTLDLDASSSDSKEGTIERYDWEIRQARTESDLSDAEPTTDSGVETTVSTEGGYHYEITLTVEDESGNSDTETETVEVTTDSSDDGIEVGDYTAQDLNGDGLYRDVDGSGSLGSNDVVTFFDHLESEAVQSNPSAFDFNDSGGVGFDDVNALLEQI